MLDIKNMSKTQEIKNNILRDIEESMKDLSRILVTRFTNDNSTVVTNHSLIR